MEDCDELWRVERVVLLLLMLAERLAGAILALGEVGSHLRPVNTHSPPPISKMRWKLAALRHVSLGSYNNFKNSECTHKNSDLQLHFVLKSKYPCITAIAHGRIDTAPLRRARSSVPQSPPLPIVIPHLLHVFLNGSSRFQIHSINCVPVTVLSTRCIKQITEEGR